MDKARRSKSGIEEVRGRLSKQIERTRKMKLPTGDDAVKYWFRPPEPPPVDLTKPPEPDGDDEVDPSDPDSRIPVQEQPRQQVTRPAIVADTRPHRTQAVPSVPDSYMAFRAQEDAAGCVSRSIVRVPISDLPAGDSDVLIRVDYSSLNYKDALAATGNKGVAGKLPLTPGIDAAGVVAESHSPIYAPGDEVIVTGFDLGTYFDGGYGRYIRVPSDWIVRCPPEIDLKTAMAYGTAGFTAALSVNELERNGIGPRSGEVLVTGATGGVGSIAVALLAQSGYEVTAITGKQSEHAYLFELGASHVIDRDDYMKTDDTKPMHTSRWSGIVDSVGGKILERALKEAHYGAAVTCCGMVAGKGLNTSIFPFILRGVRLIGIESTLTLIPLRNRIWRRIANEWFLSCLDQVTKEITIDQLDDAIQAILQGDSRGRVVLRHED